MMDPILFWNELALDANRDSHTNGTDAGALGPPLSARALAIVHLAMYDAYAGAKGNPAHLPAYQTGLTNPAAGTASPEAAASKAASSTLSTLHPSQAAIFTAKHITYIGTLTASAAQKAAGEAFGTTVAVKIMADRASDPDAGDTSYMPSPARGRHRKDPDNPGQPFHAPFYGSRSSCFAVSKRYSLDEPPALDSPEYMDALREVRVKGIAPELMGMPHPTTHTPRTVDETLIGIYWGYDGAAKLGTPPRLYNQIVRQIADAKGNDADKNARLFALVNVAMADAGILAWADKYKYDLWRPVLGIREHDTSMGPNGTGNNNISNDCDTNWLPLGAPKTNEPPKDNTPPTPDELGKKNFTPPFPAYPSGHATFGAAAFQATRLFYGVTANGPDNLANGLSFVSEEFNGINVDNKGTVRPRHTRNFPGGLWQMIEENGRSRVYLGVHWVFDAFAKDGSGNPDLSRNMGGIRLGLDIANDIFATGMKKSTV